MKVSTWVMCTLALVLWVGASALAESKGKTGSNQTTVKEREAKPNQGQAAPPAVDVKGGKGGGMGGQMEKQTGPMAKKVGQAKEAADKGKGKGQDQKAQALQKQLQHEQGKHMERVARLNRLREIYVKKGDAEKIAQVDKLIAKEQQVYSRKLTQVQGQPRVNPPLAPNMEKMAEKAAEKTAAPAVTPAPAPAVTPVAAPEAPKEPKGKPAEPPKEKEKK